MSKNKPRHDPNKPQNKYSLCVNTQRLYKIDLYVKCQVVV